MLSTPAYMQMTSFSFLACTNFLILLKFGFIPATFFFFPHRSSQLVQPAPKAAESFQSKNTN